MVSMERSPSRRIPSGLPEPQTDHEWTGAFPLLEDCAAREAWKLGRQNYGPDHGGRHNHWGTFRGFSHRKSTDHYVSSYQLRQDFAQVQLGARAALHMALQAECRFGDGFSVPLLCPKFSRVHPQTGSKPLVAPHAWKAKRMKQVNF
ncbi:hypothetical protein CEP51_009098 [Fusarium floridanum]|uniref:Uncharacterized protein n=1 Tax=Fusarium floridanum TaxID=1325733 RepID=A0A428RIP4_9HYPO|nr:hypothetical protein CEP51_009098 [Fusarium floridanum]